MCVHDVHILGASQKGCGGREFIGSDGRDTQHQCTHRYAQQLFHILFGRLKGEYIS